MIDHRDKWMDVVDTFNELKQRFPEGFPFDRNGLRLGIASIEDETGELYDEWAENKRHLGNAIDQIRTETLQIAAVAMMIVEGIDNSRT